MSKSPAELKADLLRLQREAIVVNSKAVAGDQIAVARRGEILSEIAFTQVLLADVQSNAAERAASERVEWQRARVRRTKDLTEHVEKVLAGRVAVAEDIQRLASELGVKIRVLIAMHRMAGDSVRRALPLDDSIGLDLDEMAPMRAALSTLFVAAGVDHNDAVRSLEALNFGVQWRPESAIDTTAQQKAVLLSLCGRQEQRETAALAELESPHAEEEQEQTL